MTGFLIFLGILIAYVAMRFFIDLNKDNDDLQGRSADEKFEFLVGRINEAAYGGEGRVTRTDKRFFNLYETGSNQIINFQYSTGNLNIEWRYKFFQKEIIHRKTFRDVRNISLIQQSKMADLLIEEMGEVVHRHQLSVMSGQ